MQKLTFNIDKDYDIEFSGEEDSDKVDIIVYCSEVDVAKKRLSKVQIAELRKFLSDMHSWRYDDSQMQMPVTETI